ncbi:PREDICTED: bolA-like protein 1 [Thamnophis sirtalis]|uniref:BolA-like protein 1 n=1 Tax=Thamnophis sirtalis TaxID=35019 RepID=A0A6I9X9D9_9SAUR|nr:PREDICTED: bolA-like protein 1 [Thamnophis sirtalis]
MSGSPSKRRLATTTRKWVSERGAQEGRRFGDAAAAPADRPMLPSSLPALLGRALRSPAFSAGRAALSGAALEKPVESGIRAKLQAALEPLHLEVINDSHMHAVPRGSETHFRVVVASRRFEGLPLIHRHRLVNDLLQEELAGPVHSLSIQAKTPQQWEKGAKASQSPQCLGGAKHDPQMAAKLGKPTVEG